ncbi:hypothetical protein C9417_01005 [Rhizobium sp. SEMIA 4088]|nr:hypothetical protein C9417_01005 [Rhizobium sp. SEMIA 4088]
MFAWVKLDRIECFETEPISASMQKAKVQAAQKKRRIRRESRILLVLIGGQPIGVDSRIGLERWAAATDTECRMAVGLGV